MIFIIFLLYSSERRGGWRGSPHVARLYQAQSRYCDGVEIGGVYLRSWSVHHNFVRDGRYSERGHGCALSTLTRLG
jgi:hypothetical protein